jgi:hypothetical protein
MQRALLIPLTVLALMIAGCHPIPPDSTSENFWRQVRSGEVRSFMIHGLKVCVRPGSYWPVAASVYFPISHFENAKRASTQLQLIIAARLAGLEKDDITQPDARGRLEKEVLGDIRSRVPELSVQNVFLSLDIK